MAVEVRRVAPDWEHPKREDGSYRPMHQWSRRRLADVNQEYEAEGYPPLSPDNVMPFWEPDEATAYQLYEDTSEGTPLGPVFEDLEPFIEWIMTVASMSRSAAEEFVKVGSVPSAATVKGEIFVGLQIAEAKWGVLEKARGVPESLGHREGFETARSMLTPDYEPGDDTLVVHRKQWVFACVCMGCSSGYCAGIPTQPCGRVQPYATGIEGVTVDQAKALGWRKTERGWLCPFCSGESR